MLDQQKIFYGLLTLAVLATLGWGLSTAGPAGLAFAGAASLTIGGSLMCLWERSIVRSAFSLMATFCGVAVLFILLGADFVGMAQILIYVGGILALFLFGVMLCPPDLNERKLPRVLGGLGLIGAASLWVGWKVATTVQWAQRTDAPEETATNARRIGMGFLRADQYVVPFELAAIVLTVALVAAVYIARRRRVDLEPLEGEA